MKRKDKFTNLRRSLLTDPTPEEEGVKGDFDGKSMSKEEQRQKLATGEYSPSKLSEKDDEFSEYPAAGWPEWKSDKDREYSARAKALSKLRSKPKLASKDQKADQL